MKKNDETASEQMQMTADELRIQIEEIEKNTRAGEAFSCPPPAAGEFKPAVAKAMNLLLYRPRTEKELRERLLREGFEEDAIICAIRYVSYFGYLNDRKYAENYVLSNGEKKSRNALRAELAEKGVGDSDIEAALELLETDERELAADLIRKKYGEPHQFDEKELRRAAAFLGRRGFPSSIIWGVIREYQKSCLPD